MSTKGAAAENLETIPLPQASIDSSIDEEANFPLAGKTDYTTKDIDRLLKKALMDKYADIQIHKKSYHDEIAADLPTFYKTAGLLNAINISESIAAAGVIAYIKNQIIRREKDFKKILHIWSKLEEDKENPEISEEQAYTQAEDAMRHNGILFEALAKNDLRHFSKNTFKALHKKYTATLRERTQKVRRYLAQPPKAHAELIGKTYQDRGRQAVAFLKHFTIGLKKNIENPKKLETPKAILGGVKAAFNIAGSWVRHRHQGFKPLQKDLHDLKQQYANNKIVLEHWDRALEIESAVQKNFRQAVPLTLAFSSATAFMALHAGESFEHISHGNIGPLLVNIFSAIAAAGPLKELGHDLRRKWEKLSSDRAQLAEDYILMHEDHKEIKKHKTVQAGFKTLSL